MKLKKILDAHQKFNHPHSLSENLGDSFLLEQNRVFRSIRLAALNAGICFKSNRFHDYEVLPLTQLPKIIKEKSIPYVPNVNALIEIEKALPGRFNLMDVPPLRANYVLHETAHVIARLIRGTFLEQSSSQTLASQRLLALMIMTEESFANASESLMCAFSNSEMHDHFLMKNTYIFEDQDTRLRLKFAIKKIGIEASFRLLILSYLHANFLKTKISQKEFNRILNVSMMNEPKKRLNLDKKTFKILKDLFLGGFDLDPLFTIRTNSFCLKLMGVKTNLSKLFDFDFLSYFETDQRFQECLNSMGKVMLQGT